MFIRTTNLLLISLLFLSTLLLPQCRASTAETGNTHFIETENEREFSYLGDKLNGPEEWGKIHPEWELCHHGNMQSPIDLLSTRVESKPELGKLKRYYKPAPAAVKNRGHDIMIKWKGDVGYVLIDGTKYSLKQCHWHSPAEHVFNGTRNPLEAHMVHESSEGKIAVVGVTYKIGKPDPFLAEVIPHITDVGEEEKDVGVVDPLHMKLDTKKYYRYMGSLTVPPCTEGVIWTMIKKVKTVSKEQVHALREAVHDESEVNARPVQNPKGRKVSYCPH